MFDVFDHPELKEKNSQDGAEEQTQNSTENADSASVQEKPGEKEVWFDEQRKDLLRVAAAILFVVRKQAGDLRNGLDELEDQVRLSDRYITPAMNRTFGEIITQNRFLRSEVTILQSTLALIDMLTEILRRESVEDAHHTLHSSFLLLARQMSVVMIQEAWQMKDSEQIDRLFGNAKTNYDRIVAVNEATAHLCERVAAITVQSKEIENRIAKLLNKNKKPTEKAE